VLPVRPQGLGHLRGWETEVALPVAGTFTTPAKGSLRSDAVLAPEDEMPVLFVEVDNHTEPAEVVAQKLVRYRAFFRRQVKDHRGRDIPLWSTLWDDSAATRRSLSSSPRTSVDARVIPQAEVHVIPQLLT
jgi:hypothetical protein